MQDSIHTRRRSLTALIDEGAVDERVLALILPNGIPLPDEDQFWDYKSELPLAARTSAEKDNYDIKITHLIKDVVAFYNTNGGYILAGIDDSDKSVVGFNGEFDANDISKRIHGFTKITIDVKYRSLVIGNKPIGLIYIPRRPIKSDPAQFLKAAPAAENGRRAFSKNDLYLRSREECRPAQSAEDFSILFQRRRDYDVAGPNAIYVEHNLPSKDPSL